MVSREKLVISAELLPKDIDLNFVVGVLVAEKTCVNQEGVPLELTALLSCELRFVNWFEFTRRKLLPHYEENIA